MPASPTTSQPTGERATEPTSPSGHPAPPAHPVPSAPPAPSDAGGGTAAPSRDWGRVAEDGTVFVRTADGERPVGQMPDASPDEAMAFFTRRYDDLAFEVELLEQRVKAGALGPDEAAASVKQVRAAVRDAQAVGDLAGLTGRLDALTGTINAQREKRRAERNRKLVEATTAKERIAD